MPDSPEPKNQWKKGQSGNPSGKPKKTITVERDGEKVELSIAELAREHTAEAIATLVWICNNRKAAAAAQVSAANGLLDRGWGKPIQAVELAGPNGGPIETITTEMTAKEAAERYREELG